MNAMENRVFHEWHRLNDLPENWRDFCREDLAAARLQWTSDRSLIHDKAKLQQLQEDLALRWAIETGIIERLYTVDRGITVQILEAGLDALGQFHARGKISRDARAMIADHHQALEIVMDLVGGKRHLTKSHIKELHHCLTRSQKTCESVNSFGSRIDVPLLKGEWKEKPNNPLRPDGTIHEYCPPEFVLDEIEELLRLHRTHADICPEVEAAWLHHRFTQIHPFQDGNGRVARALTAGVFLRADCLALVVRDEEHKERYLDALEMADGGDLKPLVDLFADIQINDLNEAIGSLRQLRGKTLVDIVDTIAKRARRRQDSSQQRANELMDRLNSVAYTKALEVADEIRRSFHQSGVKLEAHVQEDEYGTRHWWTRQIVACARKWGYYADLHKPRRWVALKLRMPGLEEKETKFVISLHAVGRAADLHAASAFLARPLESEGDAASGGWDCHVVAEPALRFRVEYVQAEDIEARFRGWLKRVIEAGLSDWGDNI